MKENWTFKTANEYLEKYFDKPNLTYNYKRNCISALKYLDKNYNCPDYSLMLGDVYYFGDFSEPKNYKTAYKYFMKAAKQNSIPAYLHLGYIYYYGKLGKVDYKEAFLNFTRCSLINDNLPLASNAIIKLSDMYYHGQFVKKDLFFAYTIIKPLLTFENIRSLFDKNNLLADLLVRFAKLYYESDKEVENKYLYYKSLVLAKKVLSDKNTINIFEEEDLKSYINNSFKEYKLINKNNKFSYFNNNINNVDNISIDNFLVLFNKLESMRYIDEIVKSISNKNDVYIIFKCRNQYVSIPEINYADRLDTLIVKFKNFIPSKVGLIEGMEEKYEVRKDNNSLLFYFHNKKILTLDPMLNKKQEIIICSTSKQLIGKKRMAFNDRDDFSIFDVYDKSNLDA